MKRSPAVEPHADYGFFGPDSVAWKVFTHPAVVTIAFQRTVLVEVLEPRVLASVMTTQSVMERPMVRYDRTLQYTSMLIFADSAKVVKAANTLMRIHRHMVGPEPVGGGTYDALDPESQLWIHMTEWHSVLYIYEKFGPGKLSPDDELRYWAECAVAAECQTIDPESVPRDREGVRGYFDRVNTTLAASAITLETTQQILNTGGALVSKFPRAVRVLQPLIGWLVAAGTLSTLPRWMRPMAGSHQGRIADVTVTAILRPLFGILAKAPRLQVGFLRYASPNAHPIMAPVLLGIPPTRPVTVTPTEAWIAASTPKPRDQWIELRGVQRDQHHTSADETGLLPSFT
jgi:uncharacterized protein (DUF2236 family)